MIDLPADEGKITFSCSGTGDSGARRLYLQQWVEVKSRISEGRHLFVGPARQACFLKSSGWTGVEDFTVIKS